jgi:drug/metabolite transporter (DMT)-like permease
MLSAIAAVLFEDPAIAGIVDGLWLLLYGGFLSVGLAYTLQVVAQRNANPSHAVIILSLEGAFAALGGWLVLNEILTPRDLVGSALILVGMLISQIFGKDKLSSDESG